MKKTLEDIQAQIVAWRDERDWKQFHTPKDCSLSLCLEAAELLEHFQWKDGQEVAQYVKANKEALGYELADILFWTLVMAYDFEIDMTEIFEKKMQINTGKYPVEKVKGRKNKYTDYQ